MRPIQPKDPKTFQLIIGRSGIGWIIPVDVPNRADYIYCTNSEDWESAGEGFGGSTLNFILENGDVFLLHGGWHSNSSSLYTDTGVDIGNEHFTHIDTEVVSNSGETSIIEFDIEGWCLDSFDREGDIGWLKSDILPHVRSIRITKYSLGGSQTWTMVNKNEG